MNAAFLLVTSACMMGQAAEIKTAPAPYTAAPSVASSCGSDCGSSCDSGCGCESFGHKLRGRLSGMFKRGCEDNCQVTTCHTHTHKHTCHSSCDSCQPKIWNWQPKCHNHCAPASSCESCDTCDHSSFLSRIRGKFHRHESCCEGGTSCGTGCGSNCANGSCAPSVINTMPGGEKIEGPKKMPPAPGKDGPPAKQQEVRIENQPAPVTTIIPATPAAVQPSAIPPVPSAPSVEITPVPAPRVEGDRRDPF